MSSDHNQYQKSAPYDMKECGTCGYPLLPEEYAGLVEVNGKMIRPPDVAELEIADASDAWSEVLNATQWVNELRGGEDISCGVDGLEFWPQGEVVEPLCYLQETGILGGAYEQVVWGEGFPVYTAPPKREWISLTDEQIAESVGSPLDEVYLADFRKVEAKLKELNNEQAL